MTAPCRCKTAEEGARCMRAGVRMVGWLWELCSGNCTAQRPCPGDMSLIYRALWDSIYGGWYNWIWWRVWWAPRQWFSRTSVKRYLTFAQAALSYVLAGFPCATDAEVTFRRATCDPCFWRDKEKDQCTQCGCHLGGKKELVAKLAWATEQCPLYDPVKRPGEYWGPVKGETLWRRWWRRLAGWGKAGVSFFSKDGV